MESSALITTTAAEPWQQQPLVKSGTAASASALRLTGDTDQTWEGFGGCFNELGWITMSVLDEPARAKILKDLFDPHGDCRFNLCRLPIGANDYARDWYSHNEHEDDLAMERFSIERDFRFLIPYINAGRQLRPDMTLFASPWSPPTWMKQPRAYNNGTLVWTPENLRAYALYFVKFVQAYAAEGIPIRQVHVQNEPNSDQKFPSCLWTGEKMRDFIRDYLGPAFQQHGLDTQIWAGTIERADYNGWANTILGDPATRPFVSGVGYQWAGREAVQKTHASWPEVRLVQTENEFGDGTNSWGYAGHVFDLLQHYITNGVNGYCYWNMVLAPGGKSTWGWPQNAMVTVDQDTRAVTYNPEYHVMRHFSHFIQPGAIRLVLAGPCASNAVAFRNPDGAIVVVIRNPFAEARTLELQLPDAHLMLKLSGNSFNTVVC